MYGGRIGLPARLTALSPGWAAFVAAGGPGLIVFLALLPIGLAVAVAGAGVFVLFVEIATAVGGKRAWSLSPRFRSLSYRQRRVVMASVLHGDHEIDRALAPAVEEQARRLLGGQQKTRQSMVLVPIAVLLNLIGLIMRGAGGSDPPTLAQALPVIVLAVWVLLAWRREPRRIALALTALAAAEQAGAGP